MERALHNISYTAMEWMKITMGSNSFSVMWTFCHSCLHFTWNLIQLHHTLTFPKHPIWNWQTGVYTDGAFKQLVSALSLDIEMLGLICPLLWHVVVGQSVTVGLLRANTPFLPLTDKGSQSVQLFFWQMYLSHFWVQNDSQNLCWSFQLLLCQWYPQMLIYQVCQLDTCQMITHCWGWFRKGNSYAHSIGLWLQISLQHLWRSGRWIRVDPEQRGSMPIPSFPKFLNRCQ